MKIIKKTHAVRLAFLLSGFFAATLPLQAQPLPQDVRDRIGDLLTETARTTIRSGRITIDSVAADKKTLELYAGDNCAYIPFREDNVRRIYDGIRELLPAGFKRKEIVLFSDGKRIEELIPAPLRSKADRSRKRFVTKSPEPLVTRADRPYRPTAGLDGRHIALWQSHGYYFEPKLNRWEWQRARIFEIVEDLYTQSYVLPYLVPMLENAGAYVLMPRERDVQTEEAIADNDPAIAGASRYEERNGTKPWTTGEEPGFAYKQSSYKDAENPFRDGTFRQAVTVGHPDDVSTARWTPDIPKGGRYAVYVSYKTLPNSTDDAVYTVRHKGGTTRFRVNQTMGGGTWIYLGHFDFDAGCSESGCVTLSNLSHKIGRIVTADAVKIGGGQGNIARIMPAEQRNPEIDYAYETSGYPRFTEGARYWLQWAGFPDSVYSATRHTNDYRDDYLCRGLWVNYLIGGTKNAPDREGLHIPVDLSLAFHSDAGTTMNDSIIGTLGIYYTHKDDGLYPNGASRDLSRDLTDLVQSQIVSDIQALYEPEWSRRGMWDKAYFEAHVPEVPAMLLELLSHQNFADMRYGLDPRFRFTVSRAIYKGILRFLAFQYKQDCVVQPLPVDHFRIAFAGRDSVELNWQPVADPLEPTAQAGRYVLYTRIGDGGFDNGVPVAENRIKLYQQPGKIYSYKVTALNRGGESFPSEILSACRVPDEKGTVLVINGFDRISAPYSFVCDSLAGFYDEIDHGVPDGQDISFIGSQYEFRRPAPYADDDAAGFGASRADYEKEVIAGNTFDYPALHGRSIVSAGYSFVSCSNESVIDDEVNLGDYRAVDLILGKQRETVLARGACPPEFRAFPPELQLALADYCNGGGNLLVSGAYVGSDLWESDTTGASKEFAANTLKFKLRTGRAAVRGSVRSVASPYKTLKGDYDYNHELNGDCYVVESPDAIEPAADGAFTVFRYAENNLSAGVAYKGAYKVCTLGFPFETVLTDERRDSLMRGILEFFEQP